MKVFSAALILVAISFTAVSAQGAGRAGAYYTDTACGSNNGHVIDKYPGTTVKLPIGLNALSLRIDNSQFTIFKDSDCTKEPRQRGKGGCATYYGAKILCVKY